jgi:hypothetical protein
LDGVTYDRLELVHGDVAAAATNKGAQLWIGLARAALAAESSGGGDAPPAVTEPTAIAKAIDEHPKSAAYDQVIVGYLLQIADELKNAGGAEAVALRKRTSQLVSALQRSTLRQLIEMGGDNVQRFNSAIDATHGLAVDAVLAIVRAMTDAAHKTVSDPLVRMLSKLARHSEEGPLESRLQADEAVRDQVHDLLRGWSLEDPNPEAYGHALHRLTAASRARPLRSDVKQVAEPLRIVQTAVEAGVMGFGAWRAVERLVAERQVSDLVDMLEARADGSRPPVRLDVAPLWTRITSPEVVRQLATMEPPDFPTLDRVLPRLAVEAFEPLLDVLSDSKSRTTRRGLLDRLARAPRELGPSIAERLSRNIPWYVTRNLLLVLDGLPGLPEGFSTAAFIVHTDARVRREAVKLALKMPGERERALLGGLRDADPRAVRLALMSALEECPPGAVPLITDLAQDRAVSSELRVLAIKALGRIGTGAALNTLLELVDGGTNWLGRPRLASRSIELLAALMALAASGWSDRRASKLLALAAASKDPEVRNAAVKR